MLRPTTAVVLLLALALPASASAELRRVDLTVLGMDCATCAHGVRIAMEKLEGVESIQVSLERKAAEVRLRPGNRVRLSDLRQIIKHNGFKATDAAVVVSGLLVMREGSTALDVTGTGLAWKLERDPGDPRPYDEADRLLRAKPGSAVEIAGVVPEAVGSEPDRLTVRSITAR
jgi:copper chaperone CopZ